MNLIKTETQITYFCNCSEHENPPMELLCEVCYQDFEQWYADKDYLEMEIN